MDYNVEHVFESEGFKCVVVAQGAGYRCGYVGIPKTHPLYGINYNETDFEVHGGVTYSDGGVNTKYPIESDLWWFGYDCAHYEDGNDLSLITNPRLIEMELMYPTGGIVRTKEYCIQECVRLANQLKAVEDNNKEEL
jgi:hypothetical protein